VLAGRFVQRDGAAFFIGRQHDSSELLTDSICEQECLGDIYDCAICLMREPVCGLHQCG
jgi:hypothetical protein